MVGHHILFIYSDGGPYHRLTYLSVQLSLIALFLNFDLDVLVAGRTAPANSWANPVERIMSIINLGLQCVGVMRKKMGEKFEKCIAACKNLKELRHGCNEHKDDIVDTLAPAKELLTSVLRRLELKGKKFEVFNSATESEIDTFWEVLLSIEAGLTRENTTKDSFNKLASLKEFVSHCCIFCKYSITIKKCGKNDCLTCAPVKMPLEVFSGISSLPDPVIGDDGHYQSFSSVFGKDTGTIDPPSTVVSKPKKSLSFNATQQHVKNVDLLIQCEDCGMWRLIFSKKKLDPQSKIELQKILEDVSYTCGTTFDDLDLPENSKSICIKYHNCYDPIEKLYYSSGFQSICIYCSSEANLTSKSDDFFPQCTACNSKPGIHRPKRKKK